MSGLVYTRGAARMADGTVDWDGSTDIRVLLTTSSYTPNKDHNVVTDITNELSGGNYVRKATASRTVTEDDANFRSALDLADLTYTALGTAAGTPKYAVFYVEAGTDSARELIGVVDVSGNIVPNGGDIIVVWGATGAFLLTRSSAMYTRGLKILTDGTVDWDTTDIRILLTTASYTPLSTHNVVTDITNELSGGNYVRKATTGRTVIEDDASDRVALDLDDLTWIALTLASGIPRYAALYTEGGGTDATRQLLGWVDLNGSSTPNGGDWQITWPATGAIVLNE